jgi:hypothetical protein
MRLAPEVRPEQLTLRAAPGIADIGGGSRCRVSW